LKQHNRTCTFIVFNPKTDRFEKCGKQCYPNYFFCATHFGRVKDIIPEYSVAGFAEGCRMARSHQVPMGDSR